MRLRNGSRRGVGTLTVYVFVAAALTAGCADKAAAQVGGRCAARGGTPSSGLGSGVVSPGAALAVTDSSGSSGTSTTPAGVALTQAAAQQQAFVAAYRRQQYQQMVAVAARQQQQYAAKLAALRERREAKLAKRTARRQRRAEIYAQSHSRVNRTAPPEES